LARQAEITMSAMPSAIGPLGPTDLNLEAMSGGKGSPGQIVGSTSGIG